MAPTKPICVFCKKKAEKIILFTETRLKNCNEILKIRKEYNLQGKDVELPELLNEIQGYHSKCISNFTALKAKYKSSEQNIGSSINKQHQQQQQQQSSRPSISTVTE